MNRILYSAGALGLAAGLVAGTVPARAQVVNVTFLHVNNILEIGARDGVGGFAQLAALIKREKAKNPNTFVTFGGDLFGKSLIGATSKGTHMVELANAVGFDVAAVGHSEFDYGPEVLRQRLGETKFPWLTANVVTKDGKMLPGAQATWIKEMGGLKFGFFGLTYTGTPRLSSSGPDIVFQQAEEAGRNAVRTLKEAGADVVVAMSHLALTGDRALIRAVPGIDLILSGHETQPQTFYEGGVLLHKSGSNAEFLGVIDLAIEKVGARVKIRPAWRMVPVTGIEPDPAVAAIVKNWEGKLAELLDKNLGKTSVELDSRRDTIRRKETAFANMIADAMREAVNADVALTNTGGIRADRTYAANAALTRKDVMEELPNPNVVVLLEISGADLMEALENGVSRIEAAAAPANFPAISGMSLTFMASKPRGERVTGAQVGGKPIDPKATYTLATNDFLFGGGDGYVSFKNGKALIDKPEGKLMSDAVMEYIALKGTVSPKLENRIVEAK